MYWKVISQTFSNVLGLNNKINILKGIDSSQQSIQIEETVQKIENTMNQEVDGKISIKSKKNNSKILVDELRGITTIDLVFKATNLLEKICWLIILLIGTIWACYFITLQFKLFQESPYIVSKADTNADLYYPAMTVCSGGSTKYAIAERMGNYIKSKSEVLKSYPSLNIQNIQQPVLICLRSRFISKYISKYFILSAMDDLYVYINNCYYEHQRKLGCKV